MIHTKNISLDDECLKKMKSFVDKHNGNFSSAMREIICSAERTFPERSIAIDESVFNWLLNDVDGRLIPGNVLDAIIDPSLVNRIDELEKFINRRLGELAWEVSIDIDCDNASSPSNILIHTTGPYQKSRFIACVVSQSIVKNSHMPFAVKSVVNLGDDINIELAKVPNKKEGLDSLTNFFGSSEDVAVAIKSRPAFWKCIINRHVLSNYQMVTVHRNYYEDILSGNIPMGEIMIETIAKKPIQDIPLKEILPLIRQVYEASRVVDRVEVKGNNVILFHSYRNKDAIERIKKQLIMLMETNGHMYDGKITANMIVFEHRPDVGMKINEIVNNLKVSNDGFDRQLILFMTSLKDLKGLADTPMSISILGRRMGESLMQEYGKDNNIKEWDLEAFQKAFKTIDSKIHRDSELKLENKNLLYRIRKCNIVREGDSFDAYVCRAAREAFKGALNYAFGNRADMEIKKLITHGDNYCEVTIKLL